MEAFGERNGAATFDEMCARIERYRRGQPPDPHRQYRVGCILISQPVFFDDADWVREPADFSRNIVRGAGYDLTEGEGRRIWEACVERVKAHRVPIAAEAEAQVTARFPNRDRQPSGQSRVPSRSHARITSLMSGRGVEAGFRVCGRI